jgi:uncharacterized damage-inducible protein DinB
MTALQRLFAYDDWANREVIANLRKANAPGAFKLLAHIVAAESLWLDRVHNSKPRMAVWPELTLAECAAEAERLAPEWQKLLDAGDLQRAVNYRNSKGEEFHSTVEDILTHVVLHSAYHRGQIAAAVRASGAEPAYTDFIHAVRQGFVK